SIEMRHRRINLGRLGALRPTPALVVAFIALFAAMGGLGYAAAKLKPNSVKTRNIRNAAVTGDKLADGSVTSTKLAPDTVAPSAMHAHNAAKADNPGGVPPGACHIGWLKGSLTVNTANIDPNNVNVVPGFDCASKADDAVTIQREAVGQYTVSFAGNDADVAGTSSAGNNSVTAATRIDPAAS